VSTPALGFTQSPIQWILGALCSGVKRSGHEADHSHPSSAEVENCEAVHLLPLTYSWPGAYLLKRRDNFTFLPYEGTFILLTLATDASIMVGTECLCKLAFLYRV
jgi:hypothetical protein